VFDLKIMVKNIKERGKKTKNRFEETPLIHGQKDRRTETTWGLEIGD
jgi:hypothetical protein